VWTWDGSVASLKRGDTHDVVFQTPWSADRGVVLLFTGDDPYFELPLGAAQFAACGERATLEVELSWPMSPEYLLFVDELAKRGPREQALEGELAKARELAAQCEAEAAAVRAQAEQQRAEAAAAADQLAGRQVEIGRLDAERARLREESRAREAELRRATQEIASLTHALGCSTFPTAIRVSLSWRIFSAAWEAFPCFRSWRMWSSSGASARGGGSPSLRAPPSPLTAAGGGWGYSGPPWSTRWS
jgi:hypothetical protein